jgi:hypothetical protein
MVTIFTIPKAFKAHIGAIQLNAITSWSFLKPRPEIILFGDEQGTAKFAAGLGLRHIPDISRNAYGTPVLNRLFEEAQDLGRYDTLCYVNADIILLSDFMRAVRQVSSWRPPYLMIGRRWNIDLAERIEFERSDWEARLRAVVFQRSRPFDSDWVDYFLFSRGLFRGIPPFAVGRLWWDTWLVWKAVSQGVPVVDASTDVIAIHQNHPYDHVPGGLSIGSKEAKQNEKLAGGIHRSRTIEDATHTLATHENVIVIKSRSSVDMLLASLRGVCQRWSFRINRYAPRFAIPWFAVLNGTRPFRHHFGLRRENLVRLLTRFRALGSFRCRS